MQQSLVQMHPQMGPTPRHFDAHPALHLNPEYVLAMQQNHLLQQQVAQHQLQQQYHYLSQSRAAIPSTSQQQHPQQQAQQQAQLQLQQSQLHGYLRQESSSSVGSSSVNHSLFPPSTGINLVERLQDYQLRRKTPNGTVDAGYDGSPASLAAGPPPFKQMVLPTSSIMFPTPAVQQQQQQQQLHQQQAAAAAAAASAGLSLAPRGLAQHAWAYGPTHPAAAAAAAAAATNMGVGQAVVDQAPMVQTAALLTQIRGNSGNNMLFQPVFTPSYQASPGPTAFNSASFNPQPIWPNSTLLHGYHTQPFPVANAATVDDAISVSFVQPNIASQTPFIPGSQILYPPVAPIASNTQPLALPGQAAVFNYPSGHNTDPGLLLQGPLNHPRTRSQSQQPAAVDSASVLRSPIQALEMLSMGPPVPNITTMPLLPAIPTSGEGLVRFKERVLSHAEKIYAELLLYLTHTKKSLHGRPLPSLRPSMKASVLSKSAQLQQQQRQQQRQQQQQQSFAARAQAAGQYLPTTRMMPGPQPLGSNPYANSNPYAAATVAAGSMGKHSSFVTKLYGVIPAATQNTALPQPPLVPQTKAALELLSTISEQSGWKWIDGMMLGGCLHYGMEHFEEALEWFNRIAALEPDHVEVMSNIAATLYCLDRRDEAEKFWIQAIQSRPSYLEPAEHLATLLATQQRNREAVKMIEFVQEALRIEKLPNAAASSSGNNGNSANSGNSEGSGSDDAEASGTNQPAVPLEAPAPEALSSDDNGDPASPSSPESATTQPGYGSSGYAIPGHDNGRMLILIHTKANILYAMKETAAASKAYEEAVLIGTGSSFRCIQDLIQHIHSTLSPAHAASASRPTGPLLLPPDRAKRSARYVFASNHGQLPGLNFIPENQHRRSAIATTSNALLSTAKILQDGMASNGYSLHGTGGQTSAVADILALYYLSLSLQESPSTANNVGILLASVQYAPTPPSESTQSLVPKALQQQSGVPTGILPGSGLGLAFAYYSYGLQLDPKHVHLHTNLGSLLKDVGHLDYAIKMYQKAVECDGSFDIALTNLANAVKDRGRVSEAIMYYRRAVISNPDFSEAVCGLSTALNSVCDWTGRGGVILYNGTYDRWHVDGDGMLLDGRQAGCGSGLIQRVADIVSRQLKDGSDWGSGMLHSSTISMLACQLKNAVGDLTDEESVIGGAGDAGNRSDQSLDFVAELAKWAGKTSEGARVVRLVERAARVMMRRWYRDRYIRGIEAPHSNYVRPRLPASLPVPVAPTVLPFHTFTCPLPAKEVRLISQRNAQRISCSTLRSPWLSSNVYPPPPPPQPQLNIGYISSDFNNHPLAHLMQSVFGFHDPSRAKAFCYATTVSDKSVHRLQIEREAPVFRDVTSWASDRLVSQILEDKIHILVNLNGYTRGARNEIFSARPAPIQMAFMGFAGTMGAEWCDYLLADTTAVPPSTLRPWRGNVSIGDVFRDEMDADQEDWIYSENIVYCRDTFFCCDHKQSADASERSVTWQGEQYRRWKMRKELFPNLPDETIIMGNFNQLYKIDPTTFRCWLRILAGVPNAVLWLLRFPELGEANLRKTAVKWAGESVARRIVFTDVAPKHLHIARARVCDLFLDTPECNAHTTAADVLWSSTPLLTLPRYKYKMCSRIAASILKGALPKNSQGERAAAELIAADESVYEKTAIQLARSLNYSLQVYRNSSNGTTEEYGEGSGHLFDLRKLLWDNKWTCGLFDTRRWVNDLEDAYDEAWRRWVSGEKGDIYL